MIQYLFLSVKRLKAGTSLVHLTPALVMENTIYLPHFTPVLSSRNLAASPKRLRSECVFQKLNSSAARQENERGREKIPPLLSHFVKIPSRL